MSYHATKRAWMTANIFNNWLLKLSTRIAKEGRKILLLIDNCSAHGKPEAIWDLSNVEMVFVLPNITSRLLICDTGIITSTKVRYWCFQLEREVDLADHNVTVIYKIDVLTSMSGRRCLLLSLQTVGVKMDCLVLGLMILKQKLRLQKRNRVCRLP